MSMLKPKAIGLLTLLKRKTFMSTTYGSYRKQNLKLTVGDKTYTVNFDANIYHDYEPMVMYYKDGSGFPGCDDYILDDYKAEWFDESGNKVEETADMEEALTSYIEEHEDEWEFDEPNIPEPPDYEPWKED